MKLKYIEIEVIYNIIGIDYNTDNYKIMCSLGIRKAGKCWSFLFWKCENSAKFCAICGKRFPADYAESRRSEKGRNW
jgi:hypothetical protein